MSKAWARSWTAEKRRDDVAKLAQTGSTNQFALQDAVAKADLLTAPRFCTVDVERGRRAPTLYEQVYPQQNGFALIMLWLELPEDNEDEQDDDRTSKERLRDRQARYVR